jgi:asparagine synthase (glutamine-hydrolysing)
VPFLDDRLVEHVVALPGDVKLPGWRTKTILREAVGELIPPEILHRPKMGFPVPIDRWFRSELGAIVDDLVLGPRATLRGYFDRPALERMVNEHRAGAARHADRLWLLMNLEIWFRIFVDGEPPADVIRAALPSHATALGKDGRAVARHLGRADS